MVALVVELGVLLLEVRLRVEVVEGAASLDLAVGGVSIRRHNSRSAIECD